MIELLDILNEFFTKYKNIAWAFFSSVAFIWASIKIGLSAYKAIANKAKLGQRHEFQAGYFDTQEARYDRMLDLYVKLEKSVLDSENKALNAEITRLKED